ncbi:MAG: diaminopimelate epimerase [Lachnospiraceae bacterium]
MDSGKMKFTKMEALGNDYIYVNALEESVSSPEILARAICDRHFGAGGDGLILLCPSLVADFRMEMYNADGSRGKMCGNGIRSLAKYAYVKHITEKQKLQIETDVGIREVWLVEQQGKIEQIRVNMGSPCLGGIRIPVLAEGREFNYTFVSMGNPHGVIFLRKLEELEELDLMKYGAAIGANPIFPEGINVEFVSILDQHHLRLRVWERGSGETMACGTGACAAVAAANCLLACEKEMEVEMTGGTLSVIWNQEKDDMWICGGAELVYEGVWLR